MYQSQSTDPLHGMSLQKILEYLEASLGWEELGKRIKINSFTKDPSIKSSLKFLRKTPWAREKVEQLYISLITDDSQQQPQKTKSAAAKEPFVWPDLNKK